MLLTEFKKYVEDLGCILEYSAGTGNIECDNVKAEELC